MKRILQPTLIILLLAVASLAQVDDQWPLLDYLKNDYRATSIVAHIRIREAEIGGRIGGYENWRVSGEDIELFGEFRTGERIEYDQGAEAGLRQEWFAGEKIIFLLRHNHKEENKWKYGVLDNSTLEHSEERVKRLRMIERREERKRRAAQRAKPNNGLNRTRNKLASYHRGNLRAG